MYRLQSPIVAMVVVVLLLLLLVLVLVVLVGYSFYIVLYTELLSFQGFFTPKLKRCASRDRSKIHDHN